LQILGVRKLHAKTYVLGTTNTCYEWYTIQSGNTCSLIESSFGITFAQLQAWNPSLDSACDNLFLGEAYCVSGPGISTSVSSSSTTKSTSSTTTSFATPGAPTPSGTTAQCYTYHTVASGDTCSALETTFGITMAQIVYWNPSLNSGCTNLLLGEAYCVKGAVQPPSKRDAITTGPTW
jgi:LysM repeat protein